MWTAKLFVGIPVDASLARALAEANAHLVSTFIGNHSAYLHQITHQGHSYLGKCLEDVSLCDLEGLRAHITSLVTRLVPHHVPAPVVLFAYPETDE